MVAYRIGKELEGEGSRVGITSKSKEEKVWKGMGKAEVGARY